MILKNLFKITIFIAIFPAGVFPQQYSVTSPSANNEVIVNISSAISFSVLHNGETILTPSEISISLLDGRTLGRNPAVKETTVKTISEIVQPAVPVKSSEIKDNYAELEIRFERNYSVIFRAYDEGIAYRFKSKFDSTITITNEELFYRFPNNLAAYFPEEKSFISHSERLYKKVNLGEITDQRFCSLPLLLESEKGYKVALTESSLENYAGMYLKGIAKDSLALQAIFPRFPKKEELKRDRDLIVTERENFIARTSGEKNFPWRIMVISDSDKELLTNQLVYLLAPQQKIINSDWIKPGKVAWDWWNAFNVYNVDFRAGVNNDTYKEYINFASENGIEYVILDEGWYVLGDLLDVKPEINIPELVSYASERNVGIILWVVWKTLDDQFEEAFNQFSEWGVKGLKVDFMQRDDQKVVDFYWRTAAEAARREMLLDFHGSYKPAGLRRAYPNVLTREGVVGLEHNKWSKNVTPEHNVTLPFIRMLAGPMDYTPGAMINATQSNFEPVYGKPMSQGTRCHQIAMYIIYESPLQMLADSPTHYRKEQETVNFISKLPTTWDETIPLEAKVADYVVLARRKGAEWFIGAMTDWESREFELKLDFLEEGKYVMEYFQDGLNADRNAEDYRRYKSIVQKGDNIRVLLSPGGGWAARLRKVQK